MPARLGVTDPNAEAQEWFKGRVSLITCLLQPEPSSTAESFLIALPIPSSRRTHLTGSIESPNEGEIELPSEPPTLPTDTPKRRPARLAAKPGRLNGESWLSGQVSHRIPIQVPHRSAGQTRESTGWAARCLPLKQHGRGAWRPHL